MLTLIEIFENSQIIFLSFVFIISLLVGSFLNVIIFRLPKILIRVWRKQCYEFLEQKDHDSNQERCKPLRELFVKNSHCLHCNKTIKFYDNIPLVSYLILRGKCRSCKTKLSIQYPLIEALTAIFATIVAMRFGVTFQTVAGCLLTYVLLVQATIDIRHTLIPDEITLPMLWIGLLLSIPLIFVDSSSAIIGASIGYISLWLLYWVFLLVTNKEGMGFGDFKLLAMLGAWLGWQMLPFTILCSSVIGSIIGVGMVLVQGNKRIKRIPFGPFLAIAGWIALLYGNSINNWYLQNSGLL